MADGMLGVLKAIRAELEAIDARMTTEFEHLSTALGDIMRDLDDIRKRLLVRKADKTPRRAVHQSRSKP